MTTSGTLAAEASTLGRLRLVAQSDGDGGGLTVPPVLKLDRVAWSLGQGQFLQLHGAGGRLAVDLGDHVALAEPGLGGGTAGHVVLNEEPVGYAALGGGRRRYWS